MRQGNRFNQAGREMKGAAKVEELLSDLAVNGQVAASTQNQP
jgi:hypothetical protein